MISVTEGGQTTTYTYDANGNRASQTTDGVTTTYTYNNANLVTGMVNKMGDVVISSFTYTYYADGNMYTKAETQLDVTTNTTYVYDGMGRLKSETIGEDVISYYYDANGNRTLMNNDGDITSYMYDKNNRLLTEGDIVYTYDANGNTLTAGDKTYTYNSRGQQIGYTDGIVTATYAYNPSGLRSAKTVGGSTKYFVYNGMQIVFEYEDSIASGTTYYYGLNRTHSSDGDIFVYNAHGDTVQLVNNNAVVVSYTYDAFGNLTNTVGTSENAFLYCSEYFDAETQTYYLRARYYNPTNGRFTQQDAWAFMDGSNPLSLNLYTYCFNNPVMYVDPSGHVVTDWDQEHLTATEIAILIAMTVQWDSATQEEQQQYREIAESFRSKYRMPYEKTNEYGYTYADTELMKQFEQEAYAKYDSYQPDYTGVLLVGAGISQTDTPAIGPADVVAGIVIIFGSLSIYLAKGKSNPRDLERGMTSYQKGMFQREIEDWKSDHGMPPNFNVPWEVLCALAEEIKEMYKNK